MAVDSVFLLHRPGKRLISLCTMDLILQYLSQKKADAGGGVVHMQANKQAVTRIGVQRPACSNHRHQLGKNVFQGSSGGSCFMSISRFT